MMDSVEFSVIRIRNFWGSRATPEFLAEIAFLYDYIVKTGTHEPIIDMGMKLVIPFTEVAEIVEYAIDLGYITEPKRGSWGGTITPQSLRILRQLESKEPKKRRKRIDSLICPKCGEKKLKMIIYGMPADGFDFEKYFVGGCMPGKEDIGCKNCYWIGIRSNLEENYWE